MIIISGIGIAVLSFFVALGLLDLVFQIVFKRSFTNDFNSLLTKYEEGKLAIPKAIIKKK